MVGTASGQRFVLVAVLGLVLLTVIAHGAVWNHPFLELGDEALRARYGTHGLASMSSVEDGSFRPLTWLSHAFDQSVLGGGARAAHVFQGILHLGCALLAFAWLSRATGRVRLAWLAAAVFALHPLQVQSVAWWSDRAGVLAAFFALVALERDETYQRNGRRRDRVLSALAFVASLLSKPVYAFLPVAMMIADAWLARRPVRSRTILVSLGVVSGATTLWTMARAGALSSLAEVGVVARLENAVVAAGSTLRRFAAPTDLASNHPFRFDHGLVDVIAWTTILVVASGVAWFLRRKVPAWTFGWFFWLVLQAPTFGLVQFGAQGSADRFSYLPLLGLGIAVALPWRDRHIPRPIQVLILAVLVGTSFASLKEHRYWNGSIERLERDIAVAGDTAPSHLLLARILEENGRKTEALGHYNQAQLFAPESAGIMFARADLFFELGNFASSYQLYRDGLKRDDDYGPAYAQIGRIHVLERDWEMAGRAFRRAMVLQPTDALVRLDLARLMGELGDGGAQIALYQEALGLDPELPEARVEMAWVLATAKDVQLRQPEAAKRLAETEFRRSGDTSAEALEAIAAALGAMGRIEQAAEMANRAEELALELGLDAVAERIRSRRATYLNP